MAIEINSKSKDYKTTFTPANILAVVCGVLALILLGAYLFLTFTTNNLNKEIDKKESESMSLNRNIREKESEIMPIREKLESFKSLIFEHKNPINIFTVIEKNTFPNVQFISFDFDYNERRVVLQGRTDDLATIEQQLASIKKEPLLEEVTLSGVSFAGETEDKEGSGEEAEEMGLDESKGANFSLRLIFKPEVYNK